MKRFKRDFNALCNNGSVGEEKSEPCEKRSCEKIAVMVYGGISKVVNLFVEHENKLTLCVVAYVDYVLENVQHMGKGNSKNNHQWGD